MLQHTKFQSVILTMILIVSLLSIILGFVSCTQPPPPFPATATPYTPDGKLVDYEAFYPPSPESISTPRNVPATTLCVYYPAVFASDPVCDYAKSLKNSLKDTP